MSLKEVFKPKSLKISTTFIDADGKEKQVHIYALLLSLLTEKSFSKKNI